MRFADCGPPICVFRVNSLTVTSAFGILSCYALPRRTVLILIRQPPRPAIVVDRDQHEFGRRHLHPLALAPAQHPRLDAEGDRTASGAGDICMDTNHVAYLHRLEETQVGDGRRGDTAP